jgi:Protein of unknown function (DUF4079)
VNPHLDPTRTNPLLQALAYAHPAIASAGILAALLVLSWGLRMRDARLRRKGSPPNLAKRHVRFAPITVCILLGAFVLGPISSVFIREWKLLQTLHGWAGLTAISSFTAAALLGLKLRVRPDRRRSLHGNLGLLAMLAAAVAAITGIQLLP